MPEIKLIAFVLVLSMGLAACDSKDVTPEDTRKFQLQAIRVGTNALSVSGTTENMPLDQPIVAVFTIPLNRQTVGENFTLRDPNGKVPLEFSFLDQDKTVSARPANPLKLNTLYTVQIGAIESTAGSRFDGATFEFRTQQGTMTIQNVTAGGQDLRQSQRIINVSRKPEITAVFSHALKQSSVASAIRLRSGGTDVPVEATLQDGGTILKIIPVDSLEGLTRYDFVISDDLVSVDDRGFAGFTKNFYTVIDSSHKFPEITDEQLLTLVQRQTFRYFWDFAHPESGMARERNTSGDIVTSGGSGFGIMAIIVAIERGFITRAEGVSRMEKIVTFLEKADRFHGAWSHWINGVTGKAVPFSQKDNGGDLVETSFLAQGLITFRQYLDENQPGEQSLATRINDLWRGIEWDWYTRGGEKVLYWHWSPDYEWEMNHPIRGYNEALITYVLAASSPTHPVTADVYHQGWAGNGGIKNGKLFYDIQLPVGYDYGGPLFFAHYSFLGLDPRKLKDRYADYWQQNVNHTLINRSYVIDNPANYAGYSEKIWGLTASDNQNGYSAHSPTNDLGVITPTAAISSIPFTPEYSLDAIRSFYYFLGDRLWGEYGFYDAFNPTAGWYANSYLAIDQGPIVSMIENHRTGLLWDLFMSAPEVREGLEKLEFTF